MSDPRWEATIRAAARIERAAEVGDFDLLRGELEGVVSRFHCQADDGSASVVLALARACLAVLDAEDDDEEEWDEAA